MAGITILKEIVQHFGKLLYLLSYQDLDVKNDTKTTTTTAITASLLDLLVQASLLGIVELHHVVIHITSLGSFTTINSMLIITQRSSSSLS